TSTIVRGTYGLRWTRGLHFYKGDVLFADTHVEELNNLRFALPTEIAAKSDFVLPTVPGTFPGNPAFPANSGSPIPALTQSGNKPSPSATKLSGGNNLPKPTNSSPPQPDGSRMSASTRI